MVVRQIRNATLFIDYAGLKFLIDPVFAQKATYPPFPSLLRAEEYNPLVDLPVPIEEICHPDAVIITHLHRDHFDKEAALHLEKKIPVFVQNTEDQETLIKYGFQDVRILDKHTDFHDVILTKTKGQHGYVGKEDLERLGNVCGVVFRSVSEKTIYLAGDTIWNQDVSDAIESYKPSVISRSFFADSSYMLSFSVLCSCVCSRLISPSVSSWHKQDNTLMHQSPGHIQRRTPYNF